MNKNHQYTTMRIFVFLILISCFGKTFSQQILMSWSQQNVEGLTKEKYDSAQELTFNQLLEKNITDDNWCDVFLTLNSSINNQSSNQEYLQELAEQITNKEETKLQGTSRLIIWDRIINKDIIFEGKGIVVKNDLFKVGGRANQILQNLTKKNFGYVSINSTDNELLELQNRWLDFLSGKTVAEFKEPGRKNAKIQTISCLKSFHALIISLEDNPQKQEITNNCLKNIYKLDEMPKDESSPAMNCSPDRYTLAYLGMLIGDKKNDKTKDAQWWMNFWNENQNKLVWNDKKGHYIIKK